MFENFKIPQNLIPSDPRFGCGPSLVPGEFIKNLSKTGNHMLGTSHRKPMIINMVKEIQEGLTRYFNIPSDYSIVLGNGGATCLFDMIALGMVEKKITHFTCGEFSSKWFKASNNVPWIEATEISVPMGEGIDATDVPDSDVICYSLNETSTGVQSTTVPKVHNDALLAVDATSGAGQIPCDISKVDVFIFSPQKVFAGDGGLWLAILSPKAVARAFKIAEDEKRYIPTFMNWKLAINISAKSQTYNTPALTTLFYINEQLKLMNELGFNKVCELAEEKANLLYSWAEAKDYLSPFISDDKYRSRAVATINVDEKFEVNELIKIFESEKIVYGIDSYRKLGKNQFRIALFHNIKLEDLKKLIELISLAIESV